MRQTTRDLYTAAAEIRTEDIPDVEEQKADLEAEVREEYESYAAVPQSVKQQHEQYRQQLRELEGTAETFEHYADLWSDGDDCEFTLEELNGDEFAKVVDTVSGASAEGDLPDGLGMVTSLEYATVGKPAGAPADPGEWPAAVVNDLFEQLNNITAPQGVDVGNDSLASVFDGDDSGAATDGETPPAMEEFASLTDTPDAR